MQTISTTPGAQAKLALGASLNGTKTELNGAFEAILAEIASNQTGLQNILTNSSTAAVKNNASEPVESSRKTQKADLGPSARATDTSSALSADSPIQKLRQSLEDSGEPLQNFTVSAEDKPKLKAALVKSGFSEKQAEEIIKRSSDDDGEVNLGVFFNVMAEYQPTEGPVFAINAEDAPLLIQLLNDLGVPDDDIQKWVAQLPTDDNKILVQGLGRLLQKAEADSEGFKVDRTVLKDLLGKLGLDDSEVTSLLNKATDAEGKTDPKAFLSVLQQAADKQDLGMAQVMKELAARMKINPGGKKADGESRLTAASEIRAKVVKALQESTGEVNADTQDLKTILKTVAGQTGKELDLDSGAANQKGAGSENHLEQASQAEAQMTQAARSAAKASLAAAQAGARAESAGTKAAQADAASVDATKASAGQAAAKATGQAAQTTQAKGALPSYVVRQVSDQIVQMAQKQQNTLNLKLKPANLGELSLEISVKDGTVKAVMMAETVAAKNALDAGLDQLKQLLGQQGLKLERLEVMVNPDSQRQMEYAAGGQAGSGGRRGGGEDSGDGSAGDIPAGNDETTTGGWSTTNSDGERINLFA